MLQAGRRNLTDCESGALRAKQYLIIDRDSKYTAQFRRLIRDNGTKVIRLPPRSPNLNAYAERFVRSIKDECLNRMIFVGQASLRRAVREYIEHYHEERNHQGVENRLLLLPKSGDRCYRFGPSPRSARRSTELLSSRSGVTALFEILDITRSLL